MRSLTAGRFAALALLLGGLACAGNKANTDTATAQDSTRIRDTKGYAPAARDTMASSTTAKSSGYEHADTNQTPAPNSASPGQAQMTTDTSKSSGIERADTNQQHGNTDSSTQAPPSANQHNGWSTDTAAVKSDSSANNPK